MLIEILVTFLLVILVFLIYLARKPKQSKLYFVGPHSTGKTAAMLCLSGLESKTVTTLVDHKTLYKDKEITELVPYDDTNDFIKKFRLNEHDIFIFFVKNEQELESFPDLSNFKIKFVMWIKNDEKNNKNIVYLDESKENLINLMNSL